MNTFISDLSKKEYPVEEKILGSSLRKPILECIRLEYPDFNESNALSLTELNLYREKYISTYLVQDLDEFTELRKNVLEALKEHSFISDKLEMDDNSELTFGQRVSDKVATFGGSWTFIISFLVFIILWGILNVYALSNKGFDPYPFIFLNLILSCIAALQAPVIMMSQNRLEQKDRERVKNDYMINLKSELEIRMLHDKIDHLIMHQQRELIEIQKVQIEMMNDILNKVNKQ